MIVEKIILAYLLYQYVISWEFWSFPTFSFMFWITHSSYSILPPWLDAIMGKQKNLILLITSYYSESAMPIFAYLRPQTS